MIIATGLVSLLSFAHGLGYPPLASLCMKNDSVGGMFGYSMAISQSQVNQSTLVVGRPWDSLVDIYVNTNQTLTSEWKIIQVLRDFNNGTYPSHGKSLFGYTVSLSDDGAWLAVGVPGRTFSQQRQYKLEQHDYAGAVRIYRLSLAIYKYIGEIPNPNGQPRTWDRFGSKVLFKGNYLFVTANAGWDGASPQFYQAEPNATNIAEGKFPLGPTVDVTRAGIYVYQLTDASYDPATSPPRSGSIVNPYDGLFQFIQFIKQRSSVPLGMAGINFDVLTSTGSNTQDRLVLLMRDFIIVDAQSTVPNFDSACPTGLCSYLTVQLEDGSTQQFYGQGVVIEYVLNDATGSFIASGNVLTATRAGNSDWFGAGISVGFDQKYSRWVSVVGAPKSHKLYSYYKQDQSQWIDGQGFDDDNSYLRSSAAYGALVKLSPDARFMLVANAAGTQDSNGRGQVNLYYRRGTNEFLYPPQLNDVLLDQIPSDLTSPYYYSQVATIMSDKLTYGSSLVNEATDDFSSQSHGKKNVSSFNADHFGFSVAFNDQFLIFGAPVSDCVHVYEMPHSLDTQVPQPPGAPNNTGLFPVPTQDPNFKPQRNSDDSNDAWLYALIAGLIALFLIVPVVLYILKRRHKTQLIKDLKKMHGVHADKAMGAAVAESQLALNQQTRAGTQESLNKDQKILASSETLDK